MKSVLACGVAVILAIAPLALPHHANAASPEPGDSVYHSLRYDDDFSYLADPTKSTDPWDQFKYIPIGNGPLGPSYVSFGGEVRQRFESYGNPNFGFKAPPTDAYLLSRVLLDADIHITNYVRVFLQLGSDERIGNRGYTTTTDIDQLDVMQAFLDVKPPSPLGDAPVFRVGREELLYGYQRLIAVREGPNVRRDFDGFRFIDKFDGATFDFITVRPVTDSQYIFDDRTNYSQLLWGGYLTVPIGPVLKADFYELNYVNESAKYRGLVGEEQRQTFGTRLFGNANGFDWNAEAAFQQGSFRGHDIRASLLAAIGGYTFAGVPMEPRIALESNYASGDNIHSSTISTFNAMYPRLPYFAETSLLVPSNIYDIRPVLSVRPLPDVVAVFGWDTLWRASTTDGLYGSGEVEYPNTNKVSGSRVGTELSADVRWQVNQHLIIGGIAAELMAGPAVTEALGKSVTFLVAFATYRF